MERGGIDCESLSPRGTYSNNSKLTGAVPRVSPIKGGATMLSSLGARWKARRQTLT